MLSTSGVVVDEKEALSEEVNTVKKKIYGVALSEKKVETCPAGNTTWSDSGMTVPNYLVACKE